MKDRMERLVFLPFTTGCVSSSSIEVCIQHCRRPKEGIISPHTVCGSFDIPKDLKDDEGTPTSNDNMMKNLVRFPTLSKPNYVSIGLHRLTRSIKSFSQSLASKEEMEQVQMELEIGLPTDVKHITHIGFDGSATPDANRPDNLITSDFFSLYPFSIAQLEEQLARYTRMDATHDMDNMPPHATYARDNTEASLK